MVWAISHCSLYEKGGTTISLNIFLFRWGIAEPTLFSRSDFLLLCISNSINSLQYFASMSNILNVEP